MANTSPVLSWQVLCVCNTVPDLMFKEIAMIDTACICQRTTIDILSEVLRRQRSSDTRSVTVAVHLRLPVRGEPPCGLAQSTVFSVASTLRNVVRLTLSPHMASHTLRSEDNRVSLFECKHQQHRNSSMSHESATRPRRSCKYVPFESHATPTSVPNGRAPCDMWSRG